MKVFVLFLTIVLLFSGCRLVQRGDDSGSGIPKGSIQSGEYEYVWVNPQMILADSVCSLIRASRVDSIPVDPRLPKTNPHPFAEFQIKTENCLVSATINDSKDRVVQSLLFRLLNRGNYRLSPDRSALIKLRGQAGMLVVNVCGTIVRRPIE